MILTFSDGYNGDVKLFDSEPIEEDEKCVKLRCISPGFEAFTRWVTVKEYNLATALLKSCNSKMLVFVDEV